MTERPAAERETVVREGGNPFGIVAAIIGVLLVLFLAWLLFFRGPAGDGGTTVVPDDGTTDVDIDADIDAPTTDDGADAGTDGGADAGAETDTDVDAGADGS